MKKNTLSALKVALFFVLLAPLFLSCRNSGLQKRTLTVKKSDGSSVTLVAEMALTPEQQQFGFMERKRIPAGTGMLFVFDTDQILRFWMKNTPTPLSIAYIASDGVIKDILDMKPYSLADVTSTGYVRYALEVPQGWFGTVGIARGDRLILDFQ